MPPSRLARCAGDGEFTGSRSAERPSGAVVFAPSTKVRPAQRRRLGVGFYSPDTPGTPPRRWRSATPLWADASFDSVAPALSSRCIVAAVRSATVGMPIEASASAPFTDGEWLLSHNGVVDRTVLPAARTAESMVDSAQLAAHVFDRGLDALADTVGDVGAADPNARLNILAANGSRLLATTWGDTLSVLRRPDGVVVASEPYDDNPDWQDVPDRHLVEVRGGAVTLTPLKGAP